MGCPLSKPEADLDDYENWRPVGRTRCPHPPRSYRVCTGLVFGGLQALASSHRMMFSTAVRFEDMKDNSVSLTEIRDKMCIDWDVPIEMDDTSILRADVFRPVKEGRYPVLL